MHEGIDLSCVRLHSVSHFCERKVQGMTIPELAKELKVTPQAVYSRLKANNIERSNLLITGGNQLTVEGEKTIRNLYLYSKKVVQHSTELAEKTMKGLTSKALRQEVSALNTRVTEAETKLQMREAELAEWKERYDNLLKATLAQPAVPVLSDPEPAEMTFRQFLSMKLSKKKKKE